MVLSELESMSIDKPLDDNRFIGWEGLLGRHEELCVIYVLVKETDKMAGGGALFKFGKVLHICQILVKKIGYMTLSAGLDVHKGQHICQHKRQQVQVWIFAPQEC